MGSTMAELWVSEMVEMMDMKLADEMVGMKVVK